MQVLKVKPPPSGLFHLGEPRLSLELSDNGTRRVLHPGMWPSQRKWWDLQNKVRLLVGGYGVGKTRMLCMRMIALALHNAPVPVAIVSPTYPMAKKTVIPTVEAILDNLQQWFDYWRARNWRMSKLTWTQLKNAPHEFHIEYHQEGRRSVRAQLIVYSGEEPNNLKGTNLAAAGIDEPFIQEFAVFDQMFVRCRHPHSRRREINLTGTPEQLNWGYDLAEGDLRSKYDVGLVQASTLENKALPQDYLETLVEAWDPRVAEAYLHGRFVNLAHGLVYYSFNRNENVVELEMPNNAELGAGMDFNVDPMSSAVFWVVKHGNNRHIHFFDEIELPNSDTQEMAGELKARYGTAGIITPHCAKKDLVWVKRPLRTIYPDSNAGRATNAPGGKTDYDYLREAGFEVDIDPRGNGLRRDRYNAVNGLLRPNGGRVRMTISPRCKKLIKYQMLYAHELMKKDSQKAMGHLLDARDYPVVRLFPADRDSLRLVTVKGV